MGDADRGSQIPLRVKLNGNLDLVAEAIAQLLYRNERLVDIMPGNVLVLVA